MTAMTTKSSRYPALAFLLLGIAAAACDDADPPPRDASVDRPTDARPADAGAGSDARDSSSPDVLASDAPAADAPVADAPVADAPPSDAGDASPPSDTLAVDAEFDGAPPSDAPGSDGAGSDGGGTTATDAGIACSGGLSREMLCSSYCQGITSVCTGISAQFESAAACQTACSAPTWACGGLGDTTGNTLFCRISQLAAAFTAGPTVACPNAGPASPACR